MSRPPDPTAKISLLRAAETVFAEKGLAAAKVEDITRRAGLSKGAFYLHFDTKEDSFKQVVESFLARCGSHFVPPSELAELGDIDAAGMIAFWYERDCEMYAFLWQNRATLRMLQGCRDELGYLLETFREGVRGISQEWIRHGKARGFFRAGVDEDITSTLICGAYHELTLRMLAAAKRPPLEDWLRTALLTFLRAMGTPMLVEALESINRQVIHTSTNAPRGVRTGRAARAGTAREHGR
jgi:AcrR family transcriptional regulator